VKGRLLDVEGKPWAHLYGLSYEAVKGARNEETWTVAPSGMKDVGGGLRPVVLARLLCRSSRIPQKEAVVVTNDQPAPSSKSLQTESPDGSIETMAFYGPAGDEIPVEKWVALTSGGCSLCKEPLMLEFADQVWWDTVDGSPICGDCSIDCIEDEGDDIDYSKAV
jgi:hypothetical protein